MTDSPLDDIRALIQQSPPPKPSAGRAAADLGALAAAVDWIADWRGRAPLLRPILALYAGAHAEGDPAPTRTFLETVAAGDAGISRAAQHLGAGLDVFDLALDRAVGDPASGPTMSERECAATMAFGMEVLAKQPDLLILVGVGPGADAAAASLIEALAAGTDPLHLLQRLGGRETAAIAGAIVGARSQAIPILLDGLPALAAAAVVAATSPGAADHCRLAAPVGDAKLLEQAGFDPVVALDIARTDGTGGLVALSIVKLASAMAGAPA